MRSVILLSRQETVAGEKNIEECVKDTESPQQKLEVKKEPSKTNGASLSTTLYAGTRSSRAKGSIAAHDENVHENTRGTFRTGSGTVKSGKGSNKQEITPQPGRVKAVRAESTGSTDDTEGKLVEKDTDNLHSASIVGSPASDTNSPRCVKIQLTLLKLCNWYLP